MNARQARKLRKTAEAICHGNKVEYMGLSGVPPILVVQNDFSIKKVRKGVPLVLKTGSFRDVLKSLKAAYYKVGAIKVG